MQKTSCDVSQFNSLVIPEIIQDKQSLQAVFMTYKTIAGYPSGAVIDSLPGLKIEVRSSNSSFELVDQAFAFAGLQALVRGDINSAEAFDRMGDAESRQAQKVVGVSAPIIENNKTVLLVIYAGLSAFEEALAFARSFKKRYENGFVVVLTCDCDLKRKMEELNRLVEQGDITRVVVTSECGGRGPMAKMIEGLIGAWSSKGSVA